MRRKPYAQVQTEALGTSWPIVLSTVGLLEGVSCLGNSTVVNGKARTVAFLGPPKGVLERFAGPLRKRSGKTLPGPLRERSGKALPDRSGRDPGKLFRDRCGGGPEIL